MATPSHNLNVALININGLSSKMNDIQTAIALHKIDVLALTETKLDSTVENFKVDIKGFRLYRKNRTRNGGGVAVYIRRHIGADLRQNLMNTEVEIIWVEIKLPVGEPVLVGCCYRPPHSTVDYLKHICESIKSVSKERKAILLMGDFNIDWFRDSSEKRRISSVLDECKLTQIVNDTTRKCPITNTFTCIDHIYTDLQWSSLQCRLKLPSDHKLITLNVSVTKTICYKPDENFSEENFVSDITKAPWTQVIKEFFPKNALSKFKELFFQIADKHNPWKIYDSEMVENVLSGEAGNKPDKDLEQSMNNQKTFFLEHLKAAENEPQKLLKILKEILGKSLPPRLIHLNQNHFKTQSLDSFFTGQEGQNYTNEARTSFRFLIVGAKTVERLLVSLNLPVTNKKDEMTQEMLRLAAKQISEPMCYVLNRCINSEECERGPTSELEKIIPFSQNCPPDMVDLAFSFIFDIVLFMQTKQYFSGYEQPSGSLESTLQNLFWDGSEINTIDFELVEFLFSNDVLIKLKSKGFTDQALSLIKCHFSCPCSSNNPSQKSFLVRFLFSIFSYEFSSVFQQSSVDVCENHMIIFNAHLNSQTRLEMNSLHDKANESQVKVMGTRSPANRSFTDIFNIKICNYLLYCHSNGLNWIAVIKTIIQYHNSFQHERKEILQKLERYFGNEVTEEMKQSVMNVLVLSRLEY